MRSWRAGGLPSGGSRRTYLAKGVEAGGQEGRAMMEKKACPGVGGKFVAGDVVEEADNFGACWRALAGSGGLRAGCVFSE